MALPPDSDPAPQPAPAVVADAPAALHYSLDAATACAAHVLASRRVSHRFGGRGGAWLLQLLVWICIGAAAGIAAQGWRTGTAVSVWVLGGLLLGAGLFGAVLRRRLFDQLGRTHAAATGNVRLALEADGLHMLSGMGEAWVPWARVVEVAEQTGWVAVTLGPVPQVLAVPFAAFPDAAARSRWIAALEARIASACGQSGAHPSAASAAAPRAGSRAGAAVTAGEHEGATLPGALGQLGRLLAFRAPRPGALGFSPAVLLGCVVLYAALTLGVQVWEANGEGELWWYEASGLLSPFAAAAIAAALAALVAPGQLPAGRLLVALTLLLLPLPLVGLWAAPEVGNFLRALAPGEADGPLMTLMFFLPQAWLLGAAGVVAWRLAAAEPAVRARVALVAVLASGANLWLHNDPPMLWYAAVNEEARPRLNIDERVLYGQPRLLDQALAGLQPGRPGVAELYFLGVGGYGQQDVFLREVRTVESLFADRYGTTGRSALLVNNAATVHELPVANAESLGAALRAIGARMNHGEDLLFLFLTSHGSRDHRFSLAFWPFRFNDITPEMLRRALDDAGIDQRVVVVSACYSGGFIPALADARTLVITAAAADRNSFGCADQNELTDFGRAYFAEALHETRSFTAAFELARTRIAERETAEGLTPSLPQMQGGEALNAVLQRLAAPDAAPARAVPVGATPARREANALSSITH